MIFFIFILFPYYRKKDADRDTGENSPHPYSEYAGEPAG
jgi:hypothetical protein